MRWQTSRSSFLSIVRASKLDRRYAGSRANRDVWDTTHHSGQRIATHDLTERCFEPGASMEQISSNNAFNVLFTLSFFMSFAAVMMHFG
jgi:hypothetical protein